MDKHTKAEIEKIRKLIPMFRQKAAEQEGAEWVESKTDDELINAFLSGHKDVQRMSGTKIFGKVFVAQTLDESIASILEEYGSSR